MRPRTLILTLLVAAGMALGGTCEAICGLALSDGHGHVHVHTHTDGGEQHVRYHHHHGPGGDEDHHPAVDDLSDGLDFTWTGPSRVVLDAPPVLPAAIGADAGGSEPRDKRETPPPRARPGPAHYLRHIQSVVLMV